MIDFSIQLTGSLSIVGFVALFALIRGLIRAFKPRKKVSAGNRD